MRPATLRRHLMYASVASIAAVIIAAGVIYASAVARDRLVAKLEAIERRAVADANYGDAINTLRWLARLEPSEPKYSLRLADALQKNGQMTGSNELIEQLAPLYGHGYGPAYLFRARRDVMADDVSPEQLERIENELEKLHGADTDELGEVRLQLWLRTGQIARVDDLLLRSETLAPAARLAAARSYAALGMSSPAIRQATLARQSLAEQLATRETVAERLMLAEAAAMLNDIGAVAQVLRTGSILHPTGPFCVELARLHLQLSRQTSIAAHLRLQLIDSAIPLLMRSPSRTAEQNRLLYELFLTRGDASRASEFLSEATEQEPALRMELARFLATRGGNDSARSIAESIKADCQAQLRRSPYRRSARLLLAEAQVFLSEYEAAAASLSQAHESISDPAYAMSLHRTYLAWWDSKTHGVQLRSTDDLEVLEQAARYCPRSVELVRRLRDARQIVPIDSTAAIERLQSIAVRVSSAQRSPNL